MALPMKPGHRSRPNFEDGPSMPVIEKPAEDGGEIARAQ